MSQKQNPEVIKQNATKEKVEQILGDDRVQNLLDPANSPEKFILSDEEVGLLFNKEPETLARLMTYTWEEYQLFTAADEGTQDDVPTKISAYKQKEFAIKASYKESIVRFITTQIEASSKLDESDKDGGINTISFAARALAIAWEAADPYVINLTSSLVLPKAFEKFDYSSDILSDFFTYYLTDYRQETARYAEAISRPQLPKGKKHNKKNQKEAQIPLLSQDPNNQIQFTAKGRDAFRVRGNKYLTRQGIDVNFFANALAIFSHCVLLPEHLHYVKDRGFAAEISTTTIEKLYSRFQKYDEREINRGIGTLMRNFLPIRSPRFLPLSKISQFAGLVAMVDSKSSQSETDLPESTRNISAQRLYELATPVGRFHSGIEYVQDSVERSDRLSDAILFYMFPDTTNETSGTYLNHISHIRNLIHEIKNWGSIGLNPNDHILSSEINPWLNGLGVQDITLRNASTRDLQQYRGKDRKTKEIISGYIFSINFQSPISGITASIEKLQMEVLLDSNFDIYFRYPGVKDSSPIKGINHLPQSLTNKVKVILVEMIATATVPKRAGEADAQLFNILRSKGKPVPHDVSAHLRGYKGRRGKSNDELEQFCTEQGIPLSALRTKQSLHPHVTTVGRHTKGKKTMDNDTNPRSMKLLNK